MVSLRCKGRCGRRLSGVHIGGDAQSTEGPRRGPSRSVGSRGRGQEDPDMSPTATNPLAPAQTCRRPPAPGLWLVAAQTAPAPVPRSKCGAGWLPLERRRARGMRCCMQAERRGANLEAGVVAPRRRAMLYRGRLCFTHAFSEPRSFPAFFSSRISFLRVSSANLRSEIQRH